MKILAFDYVILTYSEYIGTTLHVNIMYIFMLKLNVPKLAVSVF